MNTFKFFLTTAQLKKVQQHIKKQNHTLEGGMIIMQIFQVGGIVKGAFFERHLASEIQNTIKMSMELHDEDLNKE